MRPIPPSQRKQIGEQEFFRRCCITGSYAVSIEHSWIYAGKQINELWAFTPLRRDLNTSHPPVEVKQRCQLISLRRATKSELMKYPKKDWEQERRFLESEEKKLYPGMSQDEIFEFLSDKYN